MLLQIRFVAAPENIKTGFTAMMMKYKRCFDERNAAFAAKLRNPNSVELQRRWALQRSQLQKRLREMENTWWLSKATKIQNYADANMAHQFYEAINAVYGRKSHSPHPVRAKDGITLIQIRRTSFLAGRSTSRNCQIRTILWINPQLISCRNFPSYLNLILFLP